MNVSKILFTGALVLLGAIGVVAAVKKKGVSSSQKNLFTSSASDTKRGNTEALVFPQPLPRVTSSPLDTRDDFPMIDRVYQLFTTGPNKLPIVETISYASHVPWLKGRPAWVADYATYYSTSRHFIARSLNGKPDYYNQRVSLGSKFNVFRNDRHFEFYLLVDLSLCKMGFYYIDLDTNERLLIKTYRVAVGKSAQTPSGSLTPLGKYFLGDKIAVYKPGVQGIYKDKQIEMVRVFGSRWIPIEKKIEEGIQPLKGYGIHGVAWEFDPKKESYVERVLGKYETDGALELATEDMEELFAIVISKPTTLEIVKHFKEAKLPGTEVASPMR